MSEHHAEPAVDDYGFVQGSARFSDERDLALRKFFIEQEIKSLDNMEAAARQLLSLVTALLGIIFGILALSDGEFAEARSAPFVLLCAGIALLGLLVAIPAALVVLWPAEYHVRDNRPDEEARTYAQMYRRKRLGLDVALVAFGAGLIAFALLVMTLLALRYN